MGVAAIFRFRPVAPLRLQQVAGGEGGLRGGGFGRLALALGPAAEAGDRRREPVAEPVEQFETPVVPWEHVAEYALRQRLV